MVWLGVRCVGNGREIRGRGSHRGPTVKGGQADRGVGGLHDTIPRQAIVVGMGCVSSGIRLIWFLLTTDLTCSWPMPFVVVVF